MATLVLQAAGAYLGGLFGAFGATIGTAAGALGGYLIDRALLTGSQSREGPRLSGMQPLTGEDGAPLARVYGSARVGRHADLGDAVSGSFNDRAAGRQGRSEAHNFLLFWQLSPSPSAKARSRACAASGPTARSWTLRT